MLSTWKFDRAFAKSFAELTKVAFGGRPSLPGKASNVTMLNTKVVYVVPGNVRREHILLYHGFSNLICKIGHDIERHSLVHSNRLTNARPDINIPISMSNL